MQKAAELRPRVGSQPPVGFSCPQGSTRKVWLQRPKAWDILRAKDSYWVLQLPSCRAAPWCGERGFGYKAAGGQVVSALLLE